MDAATDEIAELVEQAKSEPVEAEAPPAEAEAKPATRRRRTRKTNGTKKEPEEKTMEQLADGLLPAASPKPAENVKTLGDLYAKYNIGDDPDFRVQVWRTWPKMAPGGKKFDGFYDTWDVPISYEQIQSDYGGGQFRITIVGPHPSKPNTPKHYDSINVSLAGDPNFDRVPRAMQGKADAKKDDAGSGFQIPAAPTENPKLAETALKMMQQTAQSEREERRRVEDRAEERRARAGEALTPVIEAERRRSDDVIRAERERAESERRMMNDRLTEERDRAEEQRRRMEMQRGSQRSIGEEIASLAGAGLFKSDDGGVAKEMLTQILEKHRGEMDSLVTRHTQFIESLRTGHASEISAIRDAHRREMEAEREASRSREARIEERLTSEREERRRDQDRFKEQIMERDQQWRDRMDSAKETMQSSWESRHQALMSTYENRIQWMQTEQDRLKQEVFDAKAKQEERGDVFTQLAKMREMQEVIKGFSPTPAASTPSGGIGLTGGVDWKETMAEGLAERAPAILGALFGGGGPPGAPGAPGAAPQQQYQEGQEVQTPQGTMVVVRDPQSGQLALAPKEALEAHQRAVMAQQQKQGDPGLLGGAPRSRPRVMPDPAEMQRRESSRRRVPTAVPNLAQGLPKPRPPWESVAGEEDLPPGAPPAPPSPPPAPRMTTRARQEAEAASAKGKEPMELSTQERQALSIIAKHVHESVMEADEPEEFVAKMVNAYDPNILKAIVGGYTTEQIAKGIVQVEPGSAGATPAGQQFVAAAFRQLREAVQGA
jgi:hypothetical protein